MTTQREGYVVEVGAEDDGERLDVVLGRHAASISRRVAKRLALEGKVHLEGRPVAAATRVQAGQRIEVHVPDTPSPSSVDASYLRVDDDFVYVAKPSGVHTHALRPDDPPSLADWVAVEHPECADASTDRREGGATHRLDAATSGVVCFARHAEAWRRARAAFTEGRVHKRYLGVVTCAQWPPDAERPGALDAWIVPFEPDPSSALSGDLRTRLGIDEPHAKAAAGVRIRAPLGRGEDRRRVGVRLDGTRATTVAVPLAEMGEHRLLDLTLETGHRHQIRAHLSWLGAPLLGDTLYAGCEAGRLFLHAGALCFAEPGSAASASAEVVICPPPAGFWPPQP